MARSKNPEQTTISVKDFGPIAEATVELRPLTVLVGASNTGKSYLAILLYALHRFFGAHGPRTRSVPRWLSQYLPNAGQDDRPPEREPLKIITAWLQALEDSRNQDRFDDALPETIAALVRPVLEDVGNLAPLLDAEVSRCFGVAGTQSLIRQSASKPAQIALRRRVFLGPGNEPSVNYDLTIARSQSKLRASIPANLPLRIQSLDRRSIPSILPKPFRLIDMDHPTSPAKGARCDYLLIGIGEAKMDDLRIVPLELKSSGFRASGVSKQLAGGAKLAERVVPGGQCRFVPVVVHDGAHRWQIQELAKHPVTFRDKKYAIKSLKCGTGLSEVL